jgi:inhibitor of cysteine peptidase
VVQIPVRTSTRIHLKEPDMKNRVLALGAALLILVAACGGDDGVVSIDEGDAGSMVEVPATGTLELRLEANPTTGYEWVVLQAGVVQLASQSHKPDSDATGSGGVTTLVFEPTVSGSGPLTLGYLRPWEEGVDPLETYTVMVVVED